MPGGFALGYPRPMATCYFDTEQGVVERRPGCEESSLFEDTASAARTWLIVVGTLDDRGGYRIERSDEAGLVASIAGRFETPLEVRGPVWFSGGTFAEVTVRPGAHVELFGGEVTEPLTVRGGELVWSYVRLSGRGGLVLRDGAVAEIADGSWSGVASPVVDAADSRVSVRRVAIADARGAGPLLALEDSALALEDAEICGHGGAVVAGSCSADAADPCTIDRTLVRAQGGDPALDLRGPWRVSRSTLVRDDAGGGGGTWGLLARPDSEVVTDDVHVWPGEGSGAGDVVVDVRALATVDASGWFEPPWWSRCEPAVVDPEAIGFRPERIPGVYAPYSGGLWARRYGVWWEDDYDLDGDGVADADGVPAMWDCRPHESGPLGPEVGGNDVDEDCDGLLACAGDEDADGDGFPAWVEVSVGTPCGDGGDPDDADPCAPDRCGPGTTDTAGGGEPATPTLTGFSGTGCATAPGSLSGLVVVGWSRRRRRTGGAAR